MSAADPQNSFRLTKWLQVGLTAMGLLIGFSYFIISQEGQIEQLELTVKLSNATTNLRIESLTRSMNRRFDELSKRIQRINAAHPAYHREGWERRTYKKED